MFGLIGLTSGRDGIGALEAVRMVSVLDVVPRGLLCSSSGAFVLVPVTRQPFFVSSTSPLTPQKQILSGHGTRPWGTASLVCRRRSPGLSEPDRQPYVGSSVDCK